MSRRLSLRRARFRVRRVESCCEVRSLHGLFHSTYAWARDLTVHALSWHFGVDDVRIKSSS
jgi:hypothetical protein